MSVRWSADDLHGDDLVASRVIAAGYFCRVYAFALINTALYVYANGLCTHLEATHGDGCTSVVSTCSYATLIIAALYALQLAWMEAIS